MPLAPWNIPPNFLGAIQAGAGAGLAARRADLEEQSSGDRLQLAYNQLAEEERQRNEAAQARMQMATAANALRASQIDMLSRYHQGQLQNQQAGEAQRAQIAQQTLAQKLALANRPTVHFGTEGEVIQRDPVTGELTDVKPPRAKLSRMPSVRVPVDPANLDKGTITGSLDDPEIARRLRPAPAAAPTPGLLDRLFGRGKAAAPAAAKRVTVISPDGKRGTIPADQLDDAVSAGYTEAK